jgi:hypothetical protein
MTPHPDDLPPLPGRGEATAQAVATLLEPVLAQLGHQLDAISAQLEAMLALAAPSDGEAIGQLIDLHREFPAWAVWLPHHGRPWVAARMASSRAPGAGLPMVWADASSAAGLAAKMRAVDGQLPSP